MDPEPDGNPGETDLRRTDTARLAAGAAKAALENAGVSADDVDLILVATSTPDHCFQTRRVWSGSYWVRNGRWPYDISAACSGIPVCGEYGPCIFRFRIYKTALVIRADTLSKIVNWSDRSTCVLFGDGAGSCGAEVEEGEKSGIFRYEDEL